MQRREVLKRTMLATGAALTVPLSGALLSGCMPTTVPETDFTPAILSAGQYTLLNALSDTVLPASDTPSATEAGVPQVIDGIVGECYAPDQKQHYLRQFDLLSQALEQEGFMDAPAEKRLAILQALEASGGNLHQAWLHVKQQIVAFYLSSESVAENHLNYLPVPGTYEHCIRLSDTNGKAWAI